MSEVLIKFDNITKRFSLRKGDIVAVKDFSLEIKKGEILTIVGASGCGKTHGRRIFNSQFREHFT